LIAAAVVAVAVLLVVLIEVRQPPLPGLYPAVGATELVEAQGRGSETLPVASVVVGQRARPGLPPQTVFAKYLSGSEVSLAANCYGDRQWLRIKVEPGGETLQSMCDPTGGGETTVDGSYHFPYPKRVIVIAPADVRWNLILVEPGTMDSGIAVVP